ncbi:MAG: AAA family ATPase, partial [Chloroflexia bacterium]|nr:AAA family ATPase [Chloroflexia bacterium]
LDFKLMRPDKSHAGWTVFTGDNGSGKSTLLKAIAVGLVGPDTARSLQVDFSGWINQQADLREGKIKLQIVYTADDDRFGDSGRPPKHFFQAEINLKNGERETTLHAANAKTAERSIWSKSATGWFSCGYGPFRRVFGASSEATRIMAAPHTSRYATMFQEAASLAEADQWLRDLQFRALEGDQSAQSQRDQIIDFLNDSLLPNQMRVGAITSSGVTLVDRNKVEFSWQAMSDGYRAVLALIIDLLRQLYVTYGELSIDRDAQGLLTINRSGVVLIDEIDAHLHPEWQREIGFWLKQRFPKFQFIVTTHSPIICQAADPNGLFVLPEPGSGEQPRALSEADYQRVIASRPDTILLTPAFGLQNTRSPEAVEARSEYARIAGKQRAGGELSQYEQQRLQELASFALNDEEL